MGMIKNVTKLGHDLGLGQTTKFCKPLLEIQFKKPISTLKFKNLHAKIHKKIQPK